MKLITNVEKVDEFKPFNLCLKVESVEDAAKLYFTFNCAAIVETLDIGYGFNKKYLASEVRAFLDEKCPGCSSDRFFDKFYNKLKEKMAKS
jgi:hypothetical protein